MLCLNVLDDKLGRTFTLSIFDNTTVNIVSNKDSYASGISTTTEYSLPFTIVYEPNNRHFIDLLLSYCRNQREGLRYVITDSGIPIFIGNSARFISSQSAHGDTQFQITNFEKTFRGDMDEQLCVLVDFSQFNHIYSREEINNIRNTANPSNSFFTYPKIAYADRDFPKPAYYIIPILKEAFRGKGWTLTTKGKLAEKRIISHSIVPYDGAVAHQSNETSFSVYSQAKSTNFPVETNVVAPTPDSVAPANTKRVALNTDQFAYQMFFENPDAYQQSLDENLLQLFTEDGILDNASHYGGSGNPPFNQAGIFVEEDGGQDLWIPTINGYGDFDVTLYVSFTMYADVEDFGGNLIEENVRLFSNYQTVTKTIKSSCFEAIPLDPILTYRFNHQAADNNSGVVEKEFINVGFAGGIIDLHDSNSAQFTLHRFVEKWEDYTGKAFLGKLIEGTAHFDVNFAIRVESKDSSICPSEFTLPTSNVFDYGINCPKDTNVSSDLVGSLEALGFYFIVPDADAKNVVMIHREDLYANSFINSKVFDLHDIKHEHNFTYSKIAKNFGKTIVLDYTLSAEKKWEDDYKADTGRDYGRLEVNVSSAVKESKTSITSAFKFAPTFMFEHSKMGFVPHILDKSKDPTDSTTRRILVDMGGGNAVFFNENLSLDFSNELSEADGMHDCFLEEYINLISCGTEINCILEITSDLYPLSRDRLYLLDGMFGMKRVMFIVRDEYYSNNPNSITFWTYERL